MKAIKITKPFEIEVTNMEKPQFNANEVLIKIKYVGFCGSDLNTFLGKNPLVRLPIIPGHEVGGIIEDTGENVPEFIKKGMSITVNPYTNCGGCSSCRNGKVNACKYNETLGVQRNGAMCDYIVLPWQKVITANGLSTLDCALIEPMSVGFHAIERAQVTDIDTVMVIGCGMIGAGAIVRASLRGATVIAVDLSDDKLELAKQIGAAYTINSKDLNFRQKLEEITDGHGPDVIIEAVGSSTTYLMAIEEVSFTGRVVYIGYAKDEVSFQTKLFVQKELNILGSRNALPEDFRSVIRYMQKGVFPKEKFITRICSPKEALNAMQEWANEPGKVFRILVEFN